MGTIKKLKNYIVVFALIGASTAKPMEKERIVKTNESNLGSNMVCYSMRARYGTSVKACHEEPGSPIPSYPHHRYRVTRTGGPWIGNEPEVTLGGDHSEAKEDFKEMKELYELQQKKN